MLRVYTVWLYLQPIRSDTEISALSSPKPSIDCHTYGDWLLAFNSARKSWSDRLMSTLYQEEKKLKDLIANTPKLVSSSSSIAKEKKKKKSNRTEKDLSLSYNPTTLSAVDRRISALKNLNQKAESANGASMCSSVLDMLGGQKRNELANDQEQNKKATNNNDVDHI
jgi:hypothetical protein